MPVGFTGKKYLSFPLGLGHWNILNSVILVVRVFDFVMVVKIARFFFQFTVPIRGTIFSNKTEFLIP